MAGMMSLTGSFSTPERLKRVTLLHGTAVAVIAMLTLASYLLLDRALHVQRESAAAIALAQRGELLTQRIASLGAQYTLGDIAAGRDLRAAVDTLAIVERALVAGGTTPEARIGMADFLAQARRLAGLAPHDSRMGAAAAPIFAVARKPLMDELDSVVRAREMRVQSSLTLLGRLGALTALALLGTLLAEAFGIVRPAARRALGLAHDVAEFGRLATTDPLTGTLNKRGFQDRGTIEIQKARRYSRPLSLLMINPDHLDPISKAHGDAAEETLLKALTSTLFEGTRITDLVGRVGGAEFAVLLPETDLAGAELLAERLRSRISDLTVPIANAEVSCTVSIGVSAAEKDATFFWPTFQRADEALYEAKMRGRNRVFVNAA